MADVVLVELGDQLFLVGGERHLDALLAGTIAPDVTVESRVCATRAEMLALWHELSDDPADGAMPWILNPLLLARIRGAMGLAGGTVQFAPWSALLDAAAQAAVADTAAWMGRNPAGRVILRQFASAVAVPGEADLQRLRGQLVAGALATAGVAAPVAHEGGVAGLAIDVDRMEIITALE